MSTADATKTDHKIVYFDGVCHICNRSVDLLLKIDRQATLRFAPLQGKSARENIHPHPLKELDSLIYWDQGTLYSQSTAVLKILQDLGGIWKIISLALILPAALRDPIYALISRNRYHWFGKKESCRIPTPQERQQFLD